MSDGKPVRATTADEEAVMFKQSWIKAEREAKRLRAENEKLRDQLSVNKETTQKLLIELQYAEEKRSELFEDSIDRSCEIAALKEENEKMKADIKRRDEFTKVDYDLIGDLADARSKVKQENDNLREENRLVGLQMDRMADEIEKLQAELEKTKRFYIEAGLELRQLREDNKQLAAENEKLREQYDAGVAAWNPVYEIVLNERDAMKAENEKLRDECARIYVQLTDDKDDKIKQIVNAIKSVKSDNK